MSSPSHTFLTLVPASHRIAAISPFIGPIDSAVIDDSLVPAVQKTRRSSSSTSAESISAVEEPALSAVTAGSPHETAKIPEVERVVAHQFLRLGN